jgi:hypothetical protein
MADIKRLNYFTGEFLLQQDFSDEQSYHVDMRRRLNRLFHVAGIAEGLVVTQTGGSQVQVTAGTALDTAGNEIVFLDNQSYTLQNSRPNTILWLTLTYQQVNDPADHYTQGGADNYTRITERPLLQDTLTAPTDPAVIVLAKVTLGASGTITALDSSVAPRASVGPIGAAAVGQGQLANSSVTAAKLASGSVGIGALALSSTPVNVPVPSILAGTTSGTTASLTVNSLTPQFFLVSVVPAELGSKVSYTQDLQKGSSSSNPQQTLIVTVKNTGGIATAVNVTIMSFALA